MFGPVAAREFLALNELRTILRSHQEVQGTGKPFDGCMTVFSAPDYRGNGNVASVVEFDSSMRMRIWDIASPEWEWKVRLDGPSELERDASRCQLKDIVLETLSWRDLQATPKQEPLVGALREGGQGGPYRQERAVGLQDLGEQGGQPSPYARGGAG